MGGLTNGKNGGGGGGDLSINNIIIIHNKHFKIQSLLLSRSSGQWRRTWRGWRRCWRGLWRRSVQDCGVPAKSI